MDKYDSFVETAHSIRKFDAVMYMVEHMLFRQPTGYVIKTGNYWVDKLSVDVINQGEQYTGSFEIRDNVTNEEYSGTFTIDWCYSYNCDHEYNITIDYPETRYEYEFSIMDTFFLQGNKEK